MVRENKGSHCCFSCARDHRDFRFAQRYPWGNRTGTRGGLAVAPKCAPANLSINRSGKMSRKRHYILTDRDDLVMDEPPAPGDADDDEASRALDRLAYQEQLDLLCCAAGGDTRRYFTRRDHHPNGDDDELAIAYQAPQLVLRGGRPTVAHNRVRIVPWWAAEARGGVRVAGGVVGGVPLSDVEWAPLGAAVSERDAADSSGSDIDFETESDADVDRVVLSAAAAAGPSTVATPVAPGGWFTLWRRADPPLLPAPSPLEDDWQEIKMPGRAASATARGVHVVPPARKSYAEAARSVEK